MKAQTKSHTAQHDDHSDAGTTIVSLLPYYANLLGTHLVELPGLLPSVEVPQKLNRRILSILKHPLAGGYPYELLLVGELPGKRIYCMVYADDAFRNPSLL